MRCCKSFSSENALKIHVRRHVNKQSGRYQCKLCGQTFSQRSGQVSHSRVHTREKPYSCSLCARTFSQSGNLHRHVRVIHCRTALLPQRFPLSAVSAATEETRR